jgi:DNA-binding SARP family transcriptional activator
MGRLPSHHVRRPRLTSRCAGAEVVVVEAAAGYGKSVFAAELVDAWGAVAIDVLLEEGSVSAQLLVGRLHAAVARAGFLEAAASMAEAGEDVVGAVDAVIRALDGESCAIVIDDAHHAARDAGHVISRIAGELGPSQHLVVLARRLPAGAERLRRGDAVHLGADDLALRTDETLELCRSGFGLDVETGDARLLDQATGGWTAATVLAASRAKRTGEALPAIARIAGGGKAPAGAVASILEEVLVGFGAERELLMRVAQLPLLDKELVDEVTGRAGFFDRALELGLPLTPARDDWWELPGPVRDHLAAAGKPEPAVLATAAAHYGRRGELSTAFQLLLGAGELEEVGELLARAEPRDIEPIDPLELRSVISRLGDAVLERFPLAMLHVARACESAALLELRADLMARAVEAAGQLGEPALLRAVEAERASDLMRDAAGSSEVELLARRVLSETAPEEQLTRARLLSVLGRATCWRRDESGRRQEATQPEAAGYLEQASQLYLELGLRAAAAGLAPYRAIWIHFALGRPLEALAVLNEALALVLDRPRRYAYVLIFRAEVLLELGRYDEMEAALAEVERIAEQLGGSDQLSAYAQWQRLQAASLRGDATAVVEHARLVEASRGQWWDVAGPDFLADAADCLDRVGHTALASEYLERAIARPGDATALIAMAKGALLARHGDPTQAEEALAEAVEAGADVREHWRVTLLRAFAAYRRGDPEAGALAARAFEEAARIGQPQLPLLRERDITESLLGLAIETGQPAALALEASSLPLALSLLGRFELSQGGRPVALGEGQPAQLLKFVAVSGGKVPAERAIEALWPEAVVEAGRNRLRTVLSRLREAAGDVVTREGELLVLAPDIRVDLAQFHAEARQALALGASEATPAVAVARSAVSRFRGDLLPYDVYEDWLEAPREAARRTMLDLLDLCAEAAAARADLDELRRVVERTIELAPYDDARYLRAASVLLEQGRKGAALAVVRRARAALSELGLEPPLQLIRLERSLVA